ncbi:MAG: stage V sporulation protein M [Bacilli bacterium]|nr:stage V sporulation protein M [Bacilli bacterium]
MRFYTIQLPKFISRFISFLVGLFSKKDK